MSKPAKSRVWTCDGCGKRETWRKGWRTYDTVDGFANGNGAPMVGCSESCLDVALKRALAAD